ncbi:hypothetical protein FRB96_002552 [Tulasnella sp. 330]|nr:hypothetical protein FRB96_002552 [Tulasnella sp. 330]KAG8880387.1 hypothetical protein FRB98_005148 [Tulasnella sp. 332]
MPPSPSALDTMTWTWADVTSLAPLIQAPLQPIPQPGCSAPSFWPTTDEAKRGAAELVYPLKEARKSVVVFTRHLGCPFCQVTIQDMYTLAHENDDIHFFLVSQSDTETVDSYLDHLAITKWFPHITITTVPSPHPHTLYSNWGISQLTASSLLGHSVIANVAKLAKEQGIKNTTTHGSRWLSSGAFAVDERGTIAWSHVAKSADDVSDLKAAVAALKPPKQDPDRWRDLNDRDDVSKRPLPPNRCLVSHY